MINTDIILNNMTESMIVLNQKDEIVFYNSVAEKLQHLFKNYYNIGTEFSKIVSAERQGIVHYILDQVKETRKPQTTEAEYTSPEGRLHCFEVTYNPVVDQGNDLIQICIVSREITHQKVFEKRATQLLKEFSELILNANAVIFGIDSRGYITEWNTECTRITQYHKNDVLAQKLHQFVAGNQSEFEGFLKRALSDQSPENYEITLNTSRGGQVTVLVNPTVKKNADGFVIGTLFVGQDITELSKYRSSLEFEVKERTKKLKASLQKEKELVEVKNRFVAIASHEFKMPLSLIRASSRYIRRNTNLRNDDLEKLESIEKQVVHMTALLEDVLTLQKDPVRIKPAEEKIDLIAVLKVIVQEVNMTFGNTPRVRFEYDRAVLTLQSDEKLIRNIFVNLLTNALKFSPGGNTVLIKLTVQQGEIEIQVVDSGIGIDELEIERISEPFYRASNATCINGTGLGLSIVKKAIQTLGGTFDLASTLGKGTTVTVCLPCPDDLLHGYLMPFE
jgi:PAS domain S-box-containing protein